MGYSVSVNSLRRCFQEPDTHIKDCFFFQVVDENRHGIFDVTIRVIVKIVEELVLHFRVILRQSNIAVAGAVLTGLGSLTVGAGRVVVVVVAEVLIQAIDI